MRKFTKMAVLAAAITCFTAQAATYVGSYNDGQPIKITVDGSVSKWSVEVSTVCDGITIAGALAGTGVASATEVSVELRSKTVGMNLRGVIAGDAITGAWSMAAGSCSSQGSWTAQLDPFSGGDGTGSGSGGSGTGSGSGTGGSGGTGSSGSSADKGGIAGDSGAVGLDQRAQTGAQNPKRDASYVVHGQPKEFWPEADGHAKLTCSVILYNAKVEDASTVQFAGVNGSFKPAGSPEVFSAGSFVRVKLSLDVDTKSVGTWAETRVSVLGGPAQPLFFYKSKPGVSFCPNCQRSKPAVRKQFDRKED